MWGSCIWWHQKDSWGLDHESLKCQPKDLDQCKSLKYFKKQRDNSKIFISETLVYHEQTVKWDENGCK